MTQLSTQNPVVLNLGSTAWYKSTTFWGIVIALVGNIISHWGYKISPDLQGDFVQVAISVASNVAGLWAIYGRIKATKPLGFSYSPTVVTVMHPVTGEQVTHTNPPIVVTGQQVSDTTAQSKPLFDPNDPFLTGGSNDPTKF